jgi:DNA-binding transcriptional MerR regulator
MSSREVSELLGFSAKALHDWRKRRIGPRWRRATKGDSFSRPLYYREDVEKLRDAIEVVRGMKLRLFPNVRLPSSGYSSEADTATEC